MISYVKLSYSKCISHCKQDKTEWNKSTCTYNNSIEDIRKRTETTKTPILIEITNMLIKGTSKNIYCMYGTYYLYKHIVVYLSTIFFTPLFIWEYEECACECVAAFFDYGKLLIWNKLVL